jgi:chromosome segregation ATPase
MPRANYNDPTISELREVMTELQERMRDAQEANDLISSSQARLGSVLNDLAEQIKELAKRIESDERIATREMRTVRHPAMPSEIRDHVTEALYREQRPMKTPDLCTALRHNLHIEKTKDVYNALFTDRKFRRIGQGRAMLWWLSDVELPQEEV